MGWSSSPPGRRFGLKIVTAFGVHVIGAPVAHVLLDFFHVGDVLGTMDVRLFDRDQHPPLEPAPARLSDICSQGGGDIGAVKPLLVREDPGHAVDMQPDLIPDEVDEEQPRVGVLGDVAQAAHNPVAAVLRVDQDLLVEDVDETRLPGPEADVAFAMTVGGGEEEHLLAGDEGAHLRVEIAEHLIRVKGFGSFPVAGPLLQIMFAARAGHGLLDDQGGDHHLLLCRITKECRDAPCVLDDGGLMAGSRLRPSGCGIDARPRASEYRTLLELPGDHCGVEIGADAYDRMLVGVIAVDIVVVDQDIEALNLMAVDGSLPPRQSTRIVLYTSDPLAEVSALAEPTGGFPPQPAHLTRANPMPSANLPLACPGCCAHGRG